MKSHPLAYDLAGAAASRQAQSAKLDAIAGLVSAAGWLYNDGSGNFSYSAPSAAPHQLNGAQHTVSGLTPGHFLRATGADTFGFAVHGLTYSDVGAAASGHNHAGVYEPVVAAGAAGEYWAGGKTWAVLNQAAIAGLTTASTPQFVSVLLSALDINSPVVTNGVNTLATVAYATFKASLSIAQADVNGLTTASSPAFVTVKCSALTDGYVPYHVSDATGLANSVIRADANTVGIGIAPQAYAGCYFSGDKTTGANQYGLAVDATYSGTTGTYVLFTGGTVKASTTITNWYGLYVSNASVAAGAAITNQYGIYIATPTVGGTLNYSIYSVGGANYFGGSVRIGATAATYSEKFIIQGTTGYNTTFANVDYVGGSAGAGLYVIFGAASGATYSRLCALVTGGTVWGTLTLQDGGGAVVIGATAVAGAEKLRVNGSVYIDTSLRSPDYWVGAPESTYGGKFYRAASNLIYCGIPGTAAGDLFYFISSAGSGAVYITATGNIYGEGNCSFLTFTDRTPYPKDKAEAWAAVKSVKGDGKGGVDHAALHPSIAVKTTEKHPTNGTEKEVLGRNLSATVSAVLEALKDAEDRIAKLEKKAA